MDQTSKKKTLQDLREFVAKATPDELSYLLGRYGGPHNMLLREKEFTYEASKALQRMIAMKMAGDAFDELLSEET